ncbi:RNA splicing [Geosmithia morbida]|uniref:Pre-mRNA-splicing factor n=1 Tax=Geosmithia morbida TaxID=1094350 RepID=A0A9P4YWU4_9HYPO|nr:RNA splicing [Geosmithia morbida]KAF4123133.1 RNA splicing [Geosmithia morbida]
MSEPNKGRIAIKFGAPALATKPNGSRKLPAPAPSSSLGKRPRAAWDDDGSESDGEGRGRHEVITGFGADGAETGSASRKEEKKEYIIARQPNRDWRGEMRAQRRGKNLLPEEARQALNGQAQTVETEPAGKDAGIQWGLTVKPKREEQDDDGNTLRGEEGEGGDVKLESKEEEEEDEKKPRTADEEAMDALLGRKPSDSKPTVTIRPSETDAYQRDVQAAGEASTLEDYEAMPVEEFGAALLRGMGWDGKEKGTMRHTQVKRRPNRMGLGAKELKGDEDLGGWNQSGAGAGKKRSRPRLDEYRREETRKRDGRAHEDSYKRERERERDGHRHRPRDSDRDRGRNYREDDGKRRGDGHRQRGHDRNRPN